MKPKVWTLERVAGVAKIYSTRGDWLYGHPPTYYAAFRNGWMDQVTAHMRTVNRRWTREAALEIARRHLTRADWIRENRASYQAAWLNGWLEDCTAHMPPSPYLKKKQ